MSDSCDPMDCSLPDSSVHGILQARILEWIAISFSRGFSWPRNWTWVSCIAGPTEKMKPVNSKEINPEYFTRRTGAEAEAPILWSPVMKNQFIRKDPDAGKDWRQEEKGVKEDEMVGWHHWVNGHEFEQTPGDHEGQGSLECCSPWSCKELDTTKQMNNNIATEQAIPPKKNVTLLCSQFCGPGIRVSSR